MPVNQDSSTTLSQRSKIALRIFALSTLVLTLSACSVFSSKDGPEPKELEPNVANLAVSQVWQKKLDELGNIKLTVNVHGDTIAIASENGAVTLINAVSGQDLWRIRLKDKLISGVGGDGSTYAVVSVQNEVIAISNGQEQWRARLPARSYTAPLVAGGRVFVLTADRSVYAFDAQNGALLWDRINSEEALVLQKSLLLTAVGNTLVTGYSGKLTGLDPDRGALLWETPIFGSRGTNDIEKLVDVITPFSREGNVICAQAFQAGVGCVDVSQSSTLWSNKFNSVNGIAGDDEIVFGIDLTGRIQAWQRISGEKLWSSDRLQYRELTAPLIVGRALIMGDADGLLHLIDRTDGAPLNRFVTNSSGIATTPVKVGNTVIVVTANGGVYAYRPN